MDDGYLGGSAVSCQSIWKNLTSPSKEAVARAEPSGENTASTIGWENNNKKTSSKLYINKHEHTRWYVARAEPSGKNTASTIGWKEKIKKREEKKCVCNLHINRHEHTHKYVDRAEPSGEKSANMIGWGKNTSLTYTSTGMNTHISMWPVPSHQGRTASTIPQTKCHII